MRIICVLLLILISVFLSNCMSVNQSLTPSANTVVDSFDDSIKVIQKPVSSASSINEAWHTLGFRWKSKTPNIVFLDVGTAGTNNVMVVAFNIDGNIVELKALSPVTEFEDDRSYNTFSMSLDQFRRLATAKVVKMKVESINEYTVSSFGEENKATVNGKFASFLEQVDAQTKK